MHGINPNGQLLLSFLAAAEMSHINGACRIAGDWSTRICDGLWTWQRGDRVSIIDYAAVSTEHLHTVESMFIDDKGTLGSSSDHNVCFVRLSDQLHLPETADKVGCQER